jgi:multisubunit Na+/H+ antiporter MnhB subunit
MLGQSVIPVAVTVLLWLRATHPTRSYLGWTLAWTVLVIVGGGGSVFPLAFLPFVPDQTTSHYAAHLAYAVLQLPLLGVTWHALAYREGRGAPAAPRHRH